MDVEQIENLTVDELRHQWKVYWQGLQKEFCVSRGIDEGNFSRWLACKKKSPASERAVKDFLLTLVGERIPAAFGQDSKNASHTAMLPPVPTFWGIPEGHYTTSPEITALRSFLAFQSQNRESIYRRRRCSVDISLNPFNRRSPELNRSGSGLVLSSNGNAAPPEQEKMPAGFFLPNPVAQTPVTFVFNPNASIPTFQAGFPLQEQSLVLSK
jgi:hypothetical protein